MRFEIARPWPKTYPRKVMYISLNSRDTLVKNSKLSRAEFTIYLDQYTAYLVTLFLNKNITVASASDLRIGSDDRCFFDMGYI